MGNHRTDRRGSSTATPGTPATPAVGGRRRATRRARGPLLGKLPSVPVLLGIAALSISATGAVSATESTLVADETLRPWVTTQANALSGTSALGSSSARLQREEAVSRDSRRDALEDATADRLQAAAEAQAVQRNVELVKLAKSAEQHAAEIALSLWQKPLSSYRISAGFGESSGLWVNTHTGLDLSAPMGTPIMSVTNGTVTSVEYAGSYGQQIIVTTVDGEELWYCHLSAYAVSVGDEVRAGEVIGYVGSTGNSTGPHLHLEVRPGAGDPVDPFQALLAHGVQL
jgi:murein DD-endopeptidase MepM/ murein hydrolase activator NlpD